VHVVLNQFLLISWSKVFFLFKNDFQRRIINTDSKDKVCISTIMHWVTERIIFSHPATQIQTVSTWHSHVISAWYFMIIAAVHVGHYRNISFHYLLKSKIIQSILVHQSEWLFSTIVWSENDSDVFAWSFKTHRIVWNHKYIPTKYTFKSFYSESVTKDWKKVFVY